MSAQWAMGRRPLHSQPHTKENLKDPRGATYHGSIAAHG